MAPSVRDYVARLDELEQELKALSEAASQDEMTRLKLLAILRKSVAQVETPWEVISRMYMEVNPFSAPFPILCSDPNSSWHIAPPKFRSESLSGDGFSRSHCWRDQDCGGAREYHWVR